MGRERGAASGAGVAYWCSRGSGGVNIGTIMGVHVRIL